MPVQLMKDVVTWMITVIIVLGFPACSGMIGGQDLLPYRKYERVVV